MPLYSIAGLFSVFSMWPSSSLPSNLANSSPPKVLTSAVVSCATTHELFLSTKKQTSRKLGPSGPSGRLGPHSVQYSGLCASAKGGTARGLVSIMGIILPSMPWQRQGTTVLPPPLLCLVSLFHRQHLHRCLALRELGTPCLDRQRVGGEGSNTGHHPIDDLGNGEG